MAEQDINTCCVEGRSPASLCSRFTIWELGQLLWGGALGSLRDLALHARARAARDPGARCAGQAGRARRVLVYLIYLVGLVCLVEPPLRASRRKVKAKVEVEGERGDGSD